jgi:3-deoxy-D-manno-octulosonate 8-phosphate phosphatase (KDO 8-P phosphatase)
LDPADTIKLRAAAVRLLVLDVDGVLTDGRIVYTDAGDEVKRFHVRDGTGLKVWRSLGLHAAVISGRTSKAVERRAAELGLSPVFLGRENKGTALTEVLAHHALVPEQACAIGDDLQDLPVLQRCGLRVAVADACAEVRAAADYVTRVNGGAGAVREAIEWLLTLRGEWTRVVEGFSAPPHP